jgi:hypothetical protein
MDIENIPTPEPTSEMALPDELALPKDSLLIERLQAKLAEYKKRLVDLGEYTHPQQLVFEHLAMHSRSPVDTLIKIRVLSTLLETGRVNFVSLFDELIADDVFEPAKLMYPELLAHSYDNAYRVVWAYAHGKSDLVNGGTGLPELE